MKGERAQPVVHAAIDAVCLACHGGRPAGRELHLIGRSFAGENVVLPKGWPAPGGKLGPKQAYSSRLL